MASRRKTKAAVANPLLLSVLNLYATLLAAAKSEFNSLSCVFIQTKPVRAYPPVDQYRGQKSLAR